MVEDITRRSFLELSLKGLAMVRAVGAVTTASGLIVPATALATSSKKKSKKRMKVKRVITPSSPRTYLGANEMVSITPEYKKKLEASVLDYLYDNWGKKNSWWVKKGLSQDDMKKRVHYSLGWAVKEIWATLEEPGKHYLPDPLLIAASMVEESLFYEFAISRVGAGGIAQFMKPTAKGYGLVCVGKKECGKIKDVKSAHLAGSFEDYLRIRKKKSKAKRAVADIEDVPARYEEFEKLGAQQKKALVQYRTFLQANLKGRDIFDRRDIGFINQFDQRFGYRHAVPAMVTMLGRTMARCDGNVYNGLIQYNAGPRPVKRSKCRIPTKPLGSLRYAEDIVGHYRNIARRMNA